MQKSVKILERRVYNQEGDLIGLPQDQIDRFACLEIVTQIDGSGIVQVKEFGNKRCLALQVTVLIPEDFIKIPKILTTNMSANMEVFPNVIMCVYAGNSALTDAVKQRLLVSDAKMIEEINGGIESK